MAEIFLGAVVGVLVEKLASSNFRNDLARSAGILSEAQEWKRNLVQIQALLVDAGQKQVTNKSVRVWLDELQHLAYDIDSILDDLAYEALRRQLNKESDHASSSSSSSKVLKILPTCCTNFTPRKLVYGHNMSYKLDEITKRLRDLLDQKKDLCLIDNLVRSTGASNHVNQTSLVNESEFVGRVGDKEALLQLLNESCDENVSVVAIVGMGGMGKTTLANVLYKEVKSQFELSAWVCVSEDFNMLNVSKAIYMDLGGEDKSFADLNQVHQALANRISNKKFLVVLDDIWNEDYEKWRVFQLPFGGGAPGSKIIVTTRKDEVASVMDCVQPYRLKPFSHEEALSLFSQHAKPNFDSDQRLRELGEGIVQKCDGLPLALRTLGRMLRRKTNVKVWEDLLISEIWSLQDGSKILPALRLSYYDLPAHLKRVFAYCSLFPKDYMFNKDELVLLWMAEGFLETNDGNKSMESLGRDYFDELKSRSFFEQSTDDESKHGMHDLINDLATSVAGEFFFRANDWLENEALEKIHHFSLISKKNRVSHLRTFLHRASRLRTFLALAISGVNWFCDRSKSILELLPHLQFLRVLSLAHSPVWEVPESIGGLKHIRYLNLSHTFIIYLPEQVGDLYNLQSLLVRGCSRLLFFPRSFEKLINLRHLDIEYTPRLRMLSLGIAGLTNLQSLSKFIVEEGNWFKISDLKGLSNLHGQLSIQGLSKVKSVKHAQEAKLDQKEGLDEIVMEWGDVIHDSENEETAYKVLEALRPHNKLIKLKILSYNGTRFPSWVGDLSFHQLTELKLIGCESCICLPTLGQLPLLKRLFVANMTKVTTFHSRLPGPANSCQAFPVLELLEFDNMPGWRTWSTNIFYENGTISSFPLLRKISILDCPILNELSIGSLPSLVDLCIRRCPELVLRNMVGVSSSLCRLKIGSIGGLTHLCEEVIEHLGALEYLCIREYAKLTCLWESESEAYKIFVNLRELRVKDCERLESYNCPNGIKRLVIRDCSSLTSLTFELPSTLQFLEIRNCNILEDSCFNNNLSSLESLHIDGCLNLRSFREGSFAHLTELTIIDCDDIESIPENGFGFFPHHCLRYLYIDGCKNLKSFPHQHLQRLTSLKDMGLTDCPSMNDSFPSGSWPPNLSSLTIGNLKKSMSEWGSQNYPVSLARLHLLGKNSGVVSFAVEEDVMNSINTTSLCFHLPPSLHSLQINNFIDLESLSEGLQHLTRLEALEIMFCPQLRDLPTTLLPSLSTLNVFHSPKLEKRCKDRNGDYWPIISEIPSCHTYP